MKILGLSGSLRRDSHNTRLLRGAGTLLPDGAELVEFDRLGAIPPFNEDEEAAPPQAVKELKEAIADADGAADRDPRVQLLDSRRAQERARLGFEASCRNPAGRQAGGRDRRQHEPVRRGLGAGRDAQGARLDRRSGRRP